MRVSIRSLGAACLAVLLLAPLAAARGATLKNQARLRAGPSAASELLGWVPAGTRVEVTGDSAGWRQVVLPDGRSGYLWGEHFGEGEAVAAATGPSAATPPAPTPDGVPAAIEARPAPVTAADLDGVRAELARLADAQRDLSRRLDDGPRTTSPASDSALEAPLGLAPLLLLLGGAVGWVASRLVQRRRDRRQRTRLRI